MNDEMRKSLPYAEISEIFKKNLGLEGSPVAVKLAKSEEGLPDGVSEIGEPLRHCQMVNLARKEGKIFYARDEKHQCVGGAWAIGLRELSPSLKSGEFYFKLGKYESWAACMRTIKSVPHVHAPADDRPSTYATVYAPLENTPFDPHVVVILAKPLHMLKLAQSVIYKMGGRVHSSMSGIQSVCADAVAVPYMEGQVNFSLGCDGSRKFSGIEDELMVMGIPGEMIAELADALPTVTGAAGSKK